MIRHFGDFPKDCINHYYENKGIDDDGCVLQPNKSSIHKSAKQASCNLLVGGGW